MSHSMLGMVSVALLDEKLFIDNGRLLRIPTCGSGGQPPCFSHFLNIFPSEQSYQCFTCTIPNFPWYMEVYFGHCVLTPLLKNELGQDIIKGNAC